MQLRELREWCAIQKHKIVVEYVDHGISGTKKSRPQLNRLMKDATKGLQDFEAVVVWRLDRFGRSLRHLLEAVTELQEAGVSFISQKDGFDLTTSIGKLMFQLLGAFAEFERNVIAERVKAGLKNAKAKGHLPGPKIDPKKGPSRTTRWRQRKAA